MGRKRESQQKTESIYEMGAKSKVETVGEHSENS